MQAGICLYHCPFFCKCAVLSKQSCNSIQKSLEKWWYLIPLLSYFSSDRLEKWWYLWKRFFSAINSSKSWNGKVMVSQILKIVFLLLFHNWKHLQKWWYLQIQLVSLLSLQKVIVFDIFNTKILSENSSKSWKGKAGDGFQKIVFLLSSCFTTESILKCDGIFKHCLHASEVLTFIKIGQILMVQECKKSNRNQRNKQIGASNQARTRGKRSLKWMTMMILFPCVSGPQIEMSTTSPCLSCWGVYIGFAIEIQCFWQKIKKESIDWLSAVTACEIQCKTEIRDMRAAEMRHRCRDQTWMQRLDIDAEIRHRCRDQT